MDTRLRHTASSPDVMINLRPIVPKIDLRKKVIDAKAKLSSARASLSKYSLTDASASRIAARDMYLLAEREVEDACKEWCISQRTRS